MPSKPDADGVYRHMGRDITQPRLIHQSFPQYSPEARKKKLSAVVLLKLVVDVNGMPQDVQIVHSAAEAAKKPEEKPVYATLDPKAIEAVEDYRFTPALKDGQAVPVEMKVEINFQIF